MRHATIPALLALMLVLVARGEDPPSLRIGASIGDVAAVIEHHQKAFAAWVAEVSAESDPARRSRLIAQKPDEIAVARRLLSLAESTQDVDASGLALMWVYAECDDDDLRTRALESLLGDDRHVPHLADVLPALERDRHPRARRALERLAERRGVDVLAQSAAVALASWLVRFDEGGQARAEALLEEIVRIGGDAPHPEGGSLAETARARLFELQHLGIGSMVPDIDGLDLEGRRLRLFDHRGRVVLLTFWAHWCGGCMAQAAAERELIAAFDGRPFVVLGVNADPGPPEEIVAANQERQISWRSFRNDAPSSPFGSIARRWNVRTLPTTYLIGHDGTILDKWVAGIAPRDALFAAVTAAVERAEDTARTWRAEDHLPDLNVGDPAPPLSVDHWLRGEPVDAFEPGKIYVIDFWATWCGSCIAGFPEMEKLQRDFADDGVVVVAATHTDLHGCTLDAIRAMMDDPESSMDFTVACSESAETYRRWVTASGHRGIPTSLVVDRRGRIACAGYARDTREVVEMLVDGSFDLETERRAHRERMIAAATYARFGEMLRAGDPGAIPFGREAIAGPAGSQAWFLCGLAESILNQTAETMSPDLELALAAASRAISIRTDHTDISFDATLAEVEFRRGNPARAAAIMEDAVGRASGHAAGFCRERAATYRAAAGEHGPSR